MNGFLEPFFNEAIDRYTTGNGLTVIFKEDHSAELVSVQLWVKTGSMDEGHLTGSGLSHCVEHMVFKGTNRREGIAISADITSMGGQLNAYTSFDRTVYHVDMPSEQPEMAFDVLSDIAFNATLTEKDFLKERDVILREIDMAMDDPDRQVSRAVFRNVFRSHPYGNPVLGHRDVFTKLTIEDVRSYYKRRYAPNNMVLIVTGDTTREQVDKHIQKWFLAEPRRPLKARLIPSEEEQMAPREERMLSSVNMCRGSIVYRIPGLHHTDSVSLDLLASILGSGESSLLYQALREKKRLVHSISATCWNPGEQGLFWITYLCDPEKQETVEQAILDELSKIADEGIDTSELRKARRQAIVSEINARQSISSQASRLGLSEVVVGDLGYPKCYYDALQSVISSDFARLIWTYLVPNSRTIVSQSKRPPNVGQRLVKNKSELEDFKSKTLSNGARIVYQVDHSLPKIHIRCTSLGGPLYETPTNAGITGMLATMLVRDTTSRTAEEVARLVESKGGLLHEFVGNNAFGFGVEMLSQDIDTALDLTEQALIHTGYNQETFERELDAQMAQLLEDVDDIVECGRKALRAHFFEGHPYACDSYGTAYALQHLTLDDVKAHGKRLLVSKNIVICICGDFDPEMVLPKLEAIMDQLSDEPFEQILTPFSGPLYAEAHHEPIEREQSVVFKAFLGPALNTEDYYIANMIEEMLNDMSGRLFLNVRERRGLAYYVGAYRMTGLNTAMFNLMAGTTPNATQQVMEAFDEELDRIKQGDISEEELQQCRLRLLSQNRFALQAMGSRAVAAGLNCLFNVDLNNWKTHEQKLAKVTKEDILCFANNYFDDAKSISLIIGPSDAK